jgi:hypothetical protein
VTGAYTQVRPPVRARRRRWPIVVLVFLLLLAAIFVVADRVAVTVAEDQVATKLADQRPFIGKPAVSIHGFPFLTQAIGGKYDDIEVTGVGEPISGMTGARVDAHLHGVHIPLSAVRQGRPDTVPVDRVDVAISVPLAELARVAGVPSLTLSSQGSNVLAQAPVDVPGVGKVTLSATVHLSIADNHLDGALSNLRALGTSLPSSVADAAAKGLNIHVPLPNLGFDSAVAGVHAAGGNVVFTGSGRHIVLR